jgi:cell division protease FtsH
MSEKVGNISFYDSTGQTDFGFTKPYSEKTAELIDQEVNLIIAESYIRAKEVLKDNVKGLTVLAELLLEKEVIFSEDLERIFGKRKADQLKDAREAEAKSKTVDKAVPAEGPKEDKKKKPGKASAAKSDSGVSVANLAVKVKTSKKSDKKAKSKG